MTKTPSAADVAYERRYHAWFNGGMYGRERLEALNRIWAEVVRLGLEANAAELEFFGYTVVESEKVAPASFAKELLEVVIEVATRRSGTAPDINGGRTHQGIHSPVSQSLPFLLMEGQAFEQAVMNPAALALVTYLVGESCVLSHQEGSLKGPGEVSFLLHTDLNVSPPFSHCPTVPALSGR